jgi:hypothetical protein
MAMKDRRTEAPARHSLPDARPNKIRVEISKVKVDLAICRKIKDNATRCRFSGAAFCTITDPWCDHWQQSAGLTGGTDTNYATVRGKIGLKLVHQFIVPSIHLPGMELILNGPHIAAFQDA